MDNRLPHSEQLTTGDRSAEIAALIARLEKATGPDRELDARIAVACQILDDFDPSVFIVPVTYRLSDDELWAEAWAGDFRQASRKPRPFTTSIDAALTLVPERWHWRVEIYNLDNIPRSELAEGGMTKFGPGIINRAQAKGATPAIALCIAALKARQQSP